MGFIEANLGDAPEEKLPPEGNYDLTIRSHETGTNKDGTRQMVTVYMTIEGDEDYMGVMHWLVFPSKEDWEEDKEKATRMLRSVNRFLALFNVPSGPNGFDDNDLDGSTARALVRPEKGDDGEERPRLIVPRMAAAA